jgi:hypothetical protein
VDQPGSAQLLAIGMAYIAEPAVAEILRSQRRNPIAHPRVSIYGGYVYVSEVQVSV